MKLNAKQNERSSFSKNFDSKFSIMEFNILALMFVVILTQIGARGSPPLPRSPDEVVICADFKNDKNLMSDYIKPDAADADIEFCKNITNKSWGNDAEKMANL